MTSAASRGCCGAESSASHYSFSGCGHSRIGAGGGRSVEAVAGGRGSVLVAGGAGLGVAGAVGALVDIMLTGATVADLLLHAEPPSYLAWSPELNNSTLKLYFCQ